jgi:hypothetical protein
MQMRHYSLLKPREGKVIGHYYTIPAERAKNSLEYFGLESGMDLRITKQL